MTTKERAVRTIPVLMEDPFFAAAARREVAYPFNLPEDFAPWYMYFEDTGHGILAILEEHFDIAFNKRTPEGYIIPIPPNVLKRGYRVHDGYLISTAGLDYDPNSGLKLRELDYEY